jgi:cbb3-type cytochrome oxidase subunit 1
MIYFLIAVLLGVWMGMSPRGYYLPVHVHLNLLGWMSMFIYGVAYHILPRFSGRQLFSDTLSEIHFWTAHIGLIGMAISWFLFNRMFLVIFSFIEVISIILFVFNMFKTIRPASAIKPPAAS